jgi:phage terminase large subunit-like protein
MRWMFDNIRMHTDSSGNVKIDKGKSADKVDGCIAAVMALDRAMRHQEAPRRAAAGFA